MSTALFNYYIEKQKKDFTEKEAHLMRYLAHIDELTKYLKVAEQYLNKEKIRKEVIIEYPSYTGYEDGTWFFYHYESFANYLYSFKEAWLEFIKTYFDIDKSIKKNLVSKQPEIKKIPYKDDLTLGDLLDSFVKNESIKKLLEERGDSVHSYAYWRYSNPYRTLQDYKNLEEMFKKILSDAYKIIKKYHNDITVILAKDLGIAC